MSRTTTLTFEKVLATFPKRTLEALAYKYLGDKIWYLCEKKELVSNLSESDSKDLRADTVNLVIAACGIDNSEA